MIHEPHKLLTANQILIWGQLFYDVLFIWGFSRALCSHCSNLWSNNAKNYSGCMMHLCTQLDFYVLYIHFYSMPVFWKPLVNQGNWKFRLVFSWCFIIFIIMMYSMVLICFFCPVQGRMIYGNLWVSSVFIVNKGKIIIAQFMIKMLYLNNIDYDTRFLIEFLNHFQPLLKIPSYHSWNMSLTILLGALLLWKL